MTSKPTKPNRKHRWLQYSLRTFFVLLTVFCVWLGWVVYKANEQRKVVEWVQKMGGTVYYDYQYDEDGLFLDDRKPPGPKWLVQFLDVDYFQEVYLAGLSNAQVSDLTPLSKLTSLQMLYLQNTQVSDLTPLANLTSLYYFSLGNTQVSDLTPLAKLTSLESLWLDSTPVSDLTPLSGLKNLKQLNLYGTQVRELAPLAKLTSLQELDLYGMPVSEEQVEELRQALPNCKITWVP